MFRRKEKSGRAPRYRIDYMRYETFKDDLGLLMYQDSGKRGDGLNFILKSLSTGWLVKKLDVSARPRNDVSTHDAGEKRKEAGKVKKENNG